MQIIAASNTKSASTPFTFGMVPNDGSYQLCVLAKDIRGNGGDITNQRGAQCLPIVIDRTPPRPFPMNPNGDLIADGGFSNSESISILVDDTGTGVGGGAIVVSGPGRLEIYSGDPNAGGTLLASNADPFDNKHTYTSADTGLSILGNLPEGKYFIRATDQAGNKSPTLNFPIGHTLPHVQLPRHHAVSAACGEKFRRQRYATVASGRERLDAARAAHLGHVQLGTNAHCREV